MKKAFTIYIPDDCHVQMLNLCISVQKDDLSINGLTVFTNSKDDFKENGEWLFRIKGEAIELPTGGAE